MIFKYRNYFYKEVENIKKALIDNGFSNYIVDEQIKRTIKNVNQQNKHCTTPSRIQTLSLQSSEVHTKVTSLL